MQRLSQKHRTGHPELVSGSENAVKSIDSDPDASGRNDELLKNDF
jgi:hypothetical protein